MNIRILILSIFLFDCSSSLAQIDSLFVRSNNNEYFNNTPIVDTIIFDSPGARTILYNTMVLPNTINQEGLKNYGLWLDSVSFKKYKNRERELFKPESRLVVLNENKKSLILELNEIGNCCHSYLCDAEVLGNSTLNLIYYGYGSMYCFSSCNFKLTYFFSKVEIPNSPLITNLVINKEKKSLKYLSEN